MMSGLADKVVQGDVRSAARLMRGIEDGDPAAVGALDRLYPCTGRAYIVGITGAPGAGKSTLVDALVGAFRQVGKTVGVVAIDPTSPLSGGAILGDRVRMQQHCNDEGVFIRSLATRGWLGGLSRAAAGVVAVMDAMGKDVIMVETVGIGQQEVDVTRLAVTSLFVLTPDSGDSIQMMKAGILEVADIYVINKADHDGALRTRAELAAMLNHNPGAGCGLEPAIVLTEAVNGTGIAELADSIERHRDFLASHGGLAERLRARAMLELDAAVESALRERVAAALETQTRDQLLEALVQRRISPRRAAAAVMELITVARPD